MKFILSSASGSIPDDPRIQEEVFTVKRHDGTTFEQQEFVIEFTGLEDLLAFASLTDNLILKTESILVAGLPEICIYDDYIE